MAKKKKVKSSSKRRVNSKKNGNRGKTYDKIGKKTAQLKEIKNNVTLGQKLSDSLTLWAGSWTFIVGFFVFLLIWMGANAYIILRAWDPYPFILLNLVLSMLAAIQAPIILMSQNRAAERDRHQAELDYIVNRKAERENLMIMEELKKIKRKLGVK